MEVPGGGAHWAIFRTPDVRQEVTKALLFHAEARGFLFLSFHAQQNLKWKFMSSIHLFIVYVLNVNQFTSCDYDCDIS